MELVRGCLAGDEEGWSAFVERFQQPVFGLCLRMLRHRQDAEDVAQESLVRAVRNLHRWDQVRPLLPWLMTITANRCRTALERRSRRPISTEVTAEPTTTDQPERKGEIAEEINLALEELRDEYRECFVLFYQGELGCAEIGEVMGRPVGTVKTWLHRARHQVAEHCDAEASPERPFMNCNEFQQRLDEVIESHGPTANEVAALANHLETCGDTMCAQRWADQERLTAATSQWRLNVPTVDLVNQVVDELRESSNAATNGRSLTLRATYGAVSEPARSRPSGRQLIRATVGVDRPGVGSSRGVDDALTADGVATDGNGHGRDREPSPTADGRYDDASLVRATQRSPSPLGQTYASMPLSATEFVTDAVVLVVPADLSEPNEEPTRADLWADHLGRRLEPIGRELNSALETLMHAVPKSSS